MRHLQVIVLALSVGLLTACQSQEPVVLVSSQDEPAPSPLKFVNTSTRSAATALLAAFTDEQKKLARFDIKAPLRKDWHFIPRERKGLHFGDMTNEHKKLVHQLMQTALSDSGYLKATDIIWLESVLYELSNQAAFRSPNNYVIQIFGDPTDEEAAWGWRLEGHHLSINLTYTPEGIATTPLFFGTNPAVVQQGPLAGKRVLSDEHNLAVALAKSMSDEQRKAMLLDKKPRDIITGPGREASLTEPAGIHIDELSEIQRGMVFALAAIYGENISGDHRFAQAVLMMEADPDAMAQMMDLHFAWAGPIDPDEPFYYRIHSPRYVIEYSCQGKNHVHAVVHDLTDPLQQDLLKKHYEQHEHEQLPCQTTKRKRVATS